LAAASVFVVIVIFIGFTFFIPQRIVINEILDSKIKSQDGRNYFLFKSWFMAPGSRPFSSSMAQTRSPFADIF